MRPYRFLISLFLVIGTTVVVARGLGVRTEQIATATGGTLSQSGAEFSKDINPATGNRFAPIQREELDGVGKKVYDDNMVGSSGAFGPVGIRLYSPIIADDMYEMNEYLRRKSGLEPRLAELAILVAAREMDSQYVWTAHERLAQKAGLEQEIIDTVKYRKPLMKLGEKEAAIIQLGRESVGKHRVGPDTFARNLRLFGNQSVVNIVSLMGYYASTAILLNTFDQHLRPTDKPLLPIP